MWSSKTSERHHNVFLSSLHKAAENEHTLHLQLMSSAMCPHFKQIMFLITTQEFIQQLL